MDNEVTTVAISPDAKYIAIALLDYTIKVSPPSSAKFSIFLFLHRFSPLCAPSSLPMIIIERCLYLYSLTITILCVYPNFFYSAIASKVHLNAPFCIHVSDCSNFQ